MKALKTLIATGAMLAVVAPAAHATLDKVLPAKAPKATAVKVVKASHHVKPLAAKRPGNDASTGVNYIVVTSPLGTQPQVQGDDCESTGDNCTPAEACSYWGENCDQVDSSQPADDSSMEDQTPAG